MLILVQGEYVRNCVSYSRKVVTLARRTNDTQLRGNERAIEALELRKAGKGYVEIAQRLGYADHTGALKAVQRALIMTLREPADDVRLLELERLDSMLEGTWDWAANGKPTAVDRVLRIMERRSKYLGLDAPQKHEVEGDINIHVTYEDAS